MMMTPEARVKRMTISVRFIRHIVATARRRSLMTTSISTRFLKGISEIRESLLKEYIALPVYLYDHGGITISTSPFSCPWDSGFFGIIAVPLDKVRREYGWKNITAKRRKRIEGYLQDEISTLDNYYTGEVFGYRIMPESDDDNELDSCWGFYGTECMKELEAECRHIIDGQNKAAA